MSRRLFLTLCLWLPALRLARPLAPRDDAPGHVELVIVNGWILRKSDLTGRRRDL